MARTFERIFRVAPTHRLVAVRSRARGGLVRSEHWEHEEYDADGRLIARYESFEEIATATGQRRSGYRKLAPDGSVVATANDLPQI
jgi:hypothetical protein